MMRKVMLAALMAASALSAVQPAMAQQGDRGGWQRGEGRGDGARGQGQGQGQGQGNWRGRAQDGQPQGGQTQGRWQARQRAADTTPAPVPQPQARSTTRWQQRQQQSPVAQQRVERSGAGANWRDGNRNGGTNWRDRNQDRSGAVGAVGADARRDWRGNDRDGRNAGYRRDNDRDGRDWNDRNRGDRDARWNQGGRNDGGWNNRPRFDDRQRWANQRRWDNGWRNDRRYNWQDYRTRYRNVYHMPRYYAPRGWNYGYRPFSTGIYLDGLLFSDSYWLDDPYRYRLPPAYGSLRWIRYYDDALLVDIRDGYVVDVIRNFFW